MQNIGPTASSSVGGVKMSTAAASFFSDESAGDVVIYANSPSQTFRIGQTSNAMSTVAITNDAMMVNGYITTPNFISSMGIQLGLGDSVIDEGLQGVSTVTVNMVATAASNQAFGANVVALAAASNQAFGTNLSLTTGTVTVGSNANGSYPLQVQMANSSNVSIFSAGDITTFSDSRYKTDVRPIECAISRINAIGGYTFLRLGDPSPTPRRMAGVLAQEMNQVLPEVVDTDPSTGCMHVAYGNIAALLIQATKELATGRTAIAFDTAAADEAFELPLPATPSGVAPWAHAIVGATGAYSRCFAAVSSLPDGSQAVVGSCEVAGSYTAIAERGAAPSASTV